MKKITTLILLALSLSLILSACTNKNTSTESVEASLSTKEMVEHMLEQVEQPGFMELDQDMVQDIYQLDPTLLEEFSIHMPLMNVKSNEIAILKVKDAKDIATVEEAVKQRAIDIQKQFETYLPDQYENAQNYKLMSKGNYVLFIISAEADQLSKVYETFFN